MSYNLNQYTSRGSPESGSVQAPLLDVKNPARTKPAYLDLLVASTKQDIDEALTKIITTPTPTPILNIICEYRGYDLEEIKKIHNMKGQNIRNILVKCSSEKTNIPLTEYLVKSGCLELTWYHVRNIEFRRNDATVIISATAVFGWVSLLKYLCYYTLDSKWCSFINDDGVIRMAFHICMQKKYTNKALKIKMLHLMIRKLKMSTMCRMINNGHFDILLKISEFTPTDIVHIIKNIRFPGIVASFACCVMKKNKNHDWTRSCNELMNHAKALYMRRTVNDRSRTNRMVMADCFVCHKSYT